MNRRLIVRFWLIVGFLAVCLLFLLRGNLHKDFQDFGKAVKISTDNLSYELMPPRIAIFGVASKEEALKVYFGPLFAKFTEEDWDDLWHIIYGIYPEYDSENERLPLRRTQLSVSEMQEELKRRFPHPFEYFTQEQWYQFWKTLKIRK